MPRTSVRFGFAAIAAALLILSGRLVGQQSATQTPRPQPPPSVRLYVLDGGTLESDPERYQLKKEEVAVTQLSVAAYLVAHPRGTLMWDTGAVPDDSWTPTGQPVQKRIMLSDSRIRPVTVRRSLKGQLARVDAPADITYVAFSHFHWDHTANANDFAGSTWLARKAERDAMFPARPPDVPQPSTFAALKDSKTVLIDGDEHDVFGDGTVILKLAAGHTPGHQVLYVKLARTGGVVLTGDLYHYPEERTLNRLPAAEVSLGTPAARASVDAFIKRTGAQLWIQHDYLADAKLKKAPEFYD